MSRCIKFEAEHTDPDGFAYTTTILHLAAATAPPEGTTMTTTLTAEADALDAVIQRNRDFLDEEEAYARNEQTPAHFHYGDIVTIDNAPLGQWVVNAVSKRYVMVVPIAEFGNPVVNEYRNYVNLWHLTRTNTRRTYFGNTTCAHNTTDNYTDPEYGNYTQCRTCNQAFTPDGEYL